MHLFPLLHNICRIIPSFIFFCTKIPFVQETLFYTPLFGILSQIPKHTFDLDNISSIPHLWYFFVYIVDNFVYNYCYRTFFHFFIGDNYAFFHNPVSSSFQKSTSGPTPFVQFAQMPICQYLFLFFEFSLYSNNYQGN